MIQNKYVLKTDTQVRKRVIIETELSTPLIPN